MEPQTKSIIGVVSALLMLGLATYLTITGFSHPTVTTHADIVAPSTVPKPSGDGFFHFVNPQYVPAAQ